MRSRATSHPDPRRPVTDNLDTIRARERDFHDAIARELDVDALDGKLHGDRLDAALMQLSGDLNGRAVLDAGCGQGDLTLDLIARGATVTALDLSPGMTAVVRQRVARRGSEFGERLKTVTAPLEESGLAAQSVDLVVGKFVLHHVDVALGAAELHRVLRPGGRAIFIENWGGNRLLLIARERLAGRWGIPRLGTEDEHPLLPGDLEDLRRAFAAVRAHYPVFEFLVIFDRQVLRFRFPRLSRVSRALDDAVFRLLPRCRRFSYRVIVELER